MNLFIRLAINAAALWAAIQLIPGFNYEGSVGTLFLIALIFGVVNAIVRPLLLLMTCPLIILTLGLFILVINTILMSLTVWLAGPNVFNLGLYSDGFGTTFLGALVVSIVSSLLNTFVQDTHERKNKIERKKKDD
ncbi:MAG TPA: phage holin family protein [Anaerolineae bacterium]|nr:phage holin family protein [Anaerolineae bacterium]